MVIAVPIHLHAPFAREAMRARADVLLEKSPVRAYVRLRGPTKSGKGDEEGDTGGLPESRV